MKQNVWNRQNIVITGSVPFSESAHFIVSRSSSSSWLSVFFGTIPLRNKSGLYFWKD